MNSVVAHNNKNRLFISLLLALMLHLALFFIITKKLSSNNIVANQAGQSIAINIAKFTSKKVSAAIKPKQAINKKVVSKTVAIPTAIVKSSAEKIAAIEPKISSQSLPDNSDIADIPVTANFSVKGQRQLPKYPKRALRLKQEGVIYLRVLLSKQGVSERIEFSKKSVYPLLNKAAIKAVKKWHFNPTVIKGKAVKSWVEIPIEFKIG